MQEAFRENHGLQCGYCTPGMIMSAIDIVRRKGNDLDDKTIRHELEGNICRCTGYHNIVKAIAAGAKAMGKGAYTQRMNFAIRTARHVRIQISSPDDRAAGGGALGTTRGSQAPRRRPHADPDPEASARRTEAHHRHVADRRLSGIEMKGRSLVDRRVHAPRRGRDLAGVKANIPALAELAGLIGDPAVRHRGTIGGSVANNDPTADYPAAGLALGATIVTNKRGLLAGDFFKGLFETALEPDEIIVQIPVPEGEQGRLREIPEPGFALCAGRRVRVEARLRDPRRGDRRRLQRRVPHDLVRGGAQEALCAESLDGMTVPADGMSSDIHGSADYRAHLVGVLARRAVAAATA